MLWLCIQLCLHNGSWWRRVKPHLSNYGSGVGPIFHPAPRIPAILFLHHESTSYLGNVVLPKIAPAAVRRRHHCLPSFGRFGKYLMIGWQMCKRASKESHKLQSCACSHCAWNTVCIVYTYDIGINCPSGGIGFEHWTGETYFYIHCQLDTCRLPNCHCHLWKLWKCKCIDLSGFMQDIQLTTGTTIATVSSRMCLLAAQYLCKVGIFSSP